MTRRIGVAWTRLLAAFSCEATYYRHIRLTHAIERALMPLLLSNGAGSAFTLIRLHSQSATGQLPPEYGLVDAAKADHAGEPFVLPHHWYAAETV